MNYVQKLISNSISNTVKIEVLGKNWQGVVGSSVKSTLSEMCIPKVINDETLFSLLRKN